jgi:hypothetical protein
LAEIKNLFTHAAVDCRVALFEPHNCQAAPCRIDGCLHDLLLRTFRVSRKLASDLNFDLFWYDRKDRFWNELI